MKLQIAIFALVSTALASSASGGKGGKGGKGTVCAQDQTVVCKDNGNGGLLTLGNVAPGLLGQSCSGGNIYCCTTEEVEQVRLIGIF